MVDIIDATHSFTVNLPGVYPVVGISAFRTPTEAEAGANMRVEVDCIEGSLVAGSAWGHIKDADTGVAVGSRQARDLIGGDSWTWSWDLTMPGKDWNLLIEVGHVD